MEEAISVLVGVVAGGLITGGVQANRAWAERRVQTRSAARLIRMALIDARRNIDVTLMHGEWVLRLTDWTPFNETWVANRGPLSQTLSERQFEIVATTFIHIENLRVQREDHLAQLADGRSVFPRYDTEMRDQLVIGQVACDAANLALAGAAKTWREQRTAKKAAGSAKDGGTLRE